MNKFLKWFDNYWYHYKWHTIVGAFVAVFLVIVIGQMASKEKVDVYIMYAGPKSFTPAEIHEIEDAFEDIMPDLNGDGKKTVQFTDIMYLTDNKIEEYKTQAEAEGEEYKPKMDYIQEMREKYKLQLAAGDAYLLLLDPEVYNEDYGSGMFNKLEKFGIESEKAYDDTAISFKETDFGIYVSVFEAFPDDTLMCFKVMNVTEKARGKKEQIKFDNQLTLFKKVVDFKY